MRADDHGETAVYAPDPALAEGTDAEIYQQFRQVAFLLQRRIELFCALPFDKLDRLKLETLTRGIGAEGRDAAGSAGT